MFADDPFVRALDGFNPHRGYLALLDVAGRPLGLSAGLFALFALTFAATCLGLDRLARSAWPGGRWPVGVVAAALVLTAKAGNIGTNHLFEAMLLDRLIALALGWVALALVVGRPSRGGVPAAALLGLAALVHPGMGLQLAMMVAATWIVWALAGRWSGVRWTDAAAGVLALGLALLPAAAWMGGQSARLFEGLPAGEFRTLGVELQMPQHMLPHLWRMPQWLAWAAYFAVAGLAVSARQGFVGWVQRSATHQASGAAGSREFHHAAPALHEPRGSIGSRSTAGHRLILMLAVNLIGLVAAWIAVEFLGDLRATVFQPFRMATVARGLALVLIAGRVWGLAARGDGLGRCRAALLCAGLMGDWTFVVAALVEVAATLGERVAGMKIAAPLSILAVGLWFLSRHDTESGHRRIVFALAAVGVYQLSSNRFDLACNRRRLAWATAASWAVPSLAFLAMFVPEGGWGIRPLASAAGSLVGRCRFGETPIDDVERLALWCRDHTPATARFVGPPGPKTFRLWSGRSLAFNRAASPYHAAGLADWSARYRDHVGFVGSVADFVRAYYADRHGLERNYQARPDAEKAALARRQGATHVIAAAPESPSAVGPLEWLHTEGRYAVYRVRSSDRLAANGLADDPGRPSDGRADAGARPVAR